MPHRSSSCFVLATDFGVQDPYVGMMKGVITNLCPAVPILDLTHDIPSFSIRAASFLLRRTFFYFPPCSIFILVVDPGVGSSRRIVGVEAAQRFFIAPDNGLLSFLQPTWVTQAVDIRNPEYFLQNPVSTSFHGRDIMAPVATHLARGVPLKNFGPRLNLKKIVRFPLPQPRWKDSHTLVGEVMYGDKFGNIITNIDRDTLLQNAQGGGQGVEESRSSEVEEEHKSTNTQGIRVPVGASFPHFFLSFPRSEIRRGGRRESRYGKKRGYTHSRNWISEIDAPMIKNCVIRLNNRVVLQGIKRSFYEGEVAGTPIALWNSFDLLEIAVNQGRAEDVCQTHVGDPVTLEIIPQGCTDRPGLDKISP